MPFRSSDGNWNNNQPTPLIPSEQDYKLHTFSYQNAFSFLTGTVLSLLINEMK